MFSAVPQLELSLPLCCVCRPLQEITMMAVSGKRKRRTESSKTTHAAYYPRQVRYIVSAVFVLLCFIYQHG
jgi:hypothetical protein